MNGEQPLRRPPPSANATSSGIVIDPNDPTQLPVFLPSTSRPLLPATWPGMDFSVPSGMYLLPRLPMEVHNPSSGLPPLFMGHSPTTSQSTASIGHLHPFLAGLSSSPLLQSYQQMLMGNSPTVSPGLRRPVTTAFAFDPTGLSRYPSLLLPTSSSSHQAVHTPLGPPTVPIPHRPSTSSAMPPPLERPLHRLFSPTAISPIRRSVPLATPSTSTTSAESTPQGQLPTQPYYPTHFMRGTVIQLASGDLKRVEELNTADFAHSATLSDDLRVDSSTVVRIDEGSDNSSVLLCFAVGERRMQVPVEASVEHPFFVVGQGWSSCNPERTRNLYGLSCNRLRIGDVCISLTNRSCRPMAPSLIPSSSVINPPSSSSSVESSRDRFRRHQSSISESHPASVRGGRASVPGTIRRRETNKRKRADSVS